MEFDWANSLLRDNGDAINGVLWRRLALSATGAPLPCGPVGHSRLRIICSTDWADTDKIIATGHSRGGQGGTVRCTYDERIALCAPNGSGCGGAAASAFWADATAKALGCAKTAGSINDMLGYWWTDAFDQRGKAPYAFHFPVQKSDGVYGNFFLDKLGTARRGPPALLICTSQRL